MEVDYWVLARRAGSLILRPLYAERLFGLPDIKACTFLTALDCMYNIVQFVSGTFVLWVNQFLPHCVMGSEVNWCIMLRENSSEFLWNPCHIWNDNVVTFVPLFLYCQDVVPGALSNVHLTYAQLGCSKAFNAVLMWLCSLDFPPVLVGIFSAWWCRVLIIPSLWSKSW